MADEKPTLDRMIDPLRAGGEQLRAASEKFAENTSAVSLKMLDHAQKNATEAFNAMRAAAQASGITQLMEIQANFLREQAQRSMEQAREVGEMIAGFGRAVITPPGDKTDS